MSASLLPSAGQTTAAIASSIPARVRTAEVVMSPLTKYTPSPAGFLSLSWMTTILWVLVGGELGDQLARRGVPPAHDDVVPVARCAHSLAFLEQVVDEEPDEGTCERRDDRHAEEHQQPADDVADGGLDVRRVARGHRGGDRPVEGVDVLAEELADGVVLVAGLVAFAHRYDRGESSRIPSMTTPTRVKKFLSSPNVIRLKWKAALRSTGIEKYATNRFGTSATRGIIAPPPAAAHGPDGSWRVVAARRRRPGLGQHGVPVLGEHEAGSDRGVGRCAYAAR